MSCSMINLLRQLAKMFAISQLAFVNFGLDLSFQQYQEEYFGISTGEEIFLRKRLTIFGISCTALKYMASSNSDRSDILKSAQTVNLLYKNPL